MTTPSPLLAIFQKYTSDFVGTGLLKFKDFEFMMESGDSDDNNVYSSFQHLVENVLPPHRLVAALEVWQSVQSFILIFKGKEISKNQTGWLAGWLARTDKKLTVS